MPVVWLVVAPSSEIWDSGRTPNCRRVDQMVSRQTFVGSPPPPWAVARSTVWTVVGRQGALHRCTGTGRPIFVELVKWSPGTSEHLSEGQHRPGGGTVAVWQWQDARRLSPHTSGLPAPTKVAKSGLPGLLFPLFGGVQSGSLAAQVVWAVRSHWGRGKPRAHGRWFIRDMGSRLVARSLLGTRNHIVGSLGP